VMECDFFGNFLSRAVIIHADGDKWADHGGSALPLTRRLELWVRDYSLDFVVALSSP